MGSRRLRRGMLFLLAACVGRELRADGVVGGLLRLHGGA